MYKNNWPHLLRNGIARDIYEFKCCCDDLGKTPQTLTDRIKQHVPLSIRRNTSGMRIQPVRACRKVLASISTSYASTFGRHLIENANRAETEVCGYIQDIEWRMRV